VRDLRSSFAALVVGIGLGLVAGLYIAAKVQITEDRWWALAGSALGAILAISGSIFVVHYESGQSERADRRRLADQIDGIMRNLGHVDEAAKQVPPAYVQMRESMKLVTSEYRHLFNAAREAKNTSVEVARAAKSLPESQADSLTMYASSNHDRTWDAEVARQVAALRKALTKARAELRV
jgi:hypothetical protein